MRGLRVPSSYLPTGPEDGTAAYTDGRVTTALIQEFRFNQYLRRIQRLVAATLDREFKTFMAWRGFNIDNSIFELQLSEPMNFAGYREIELDGSRINALREHDRPCKRLIEVPYNCTVLEQIPQVKSGEDINAKQGFQKVQSEQGRYPQDDDGEDQRHCIVRNRSTEDVNIA